MSLLNRYAWLVDRLLAEVKGTRGPLVALAVFGSVGRGTVREDSDVDFLLVARDLPRGRFARVDEFLPARRACQLREFGAGITRRRKGVSLAEGLASVLATWN
jgi:Nucleotidyltransferase domain